MQIDALNLQLGVPRVDSFVRKDFQAFKAQMAAESGARPIEGATRTCEAPSPLQRYTSSSDICAGQLAASGRWQDLAGPPAPMQV